MTQQKILSSQLADSGVVPGTYTAADITIDAAGRVTAAASGGTGGTVTSVAISGNNGVGVAGSPITGSGTITLSLGAITPTSVGAVGTVTGSNLSGTNTGDQTITLTGDVTGSGTGAFVTTLSNTGVTAGVYTAANVTVDAKGRITSISDGTSIVIPLNEIVIGTGSGVTSDPGFTFNPATDTLTVSGAGNGVISAGAGSLLVQATGYFAVETNSIPRLEIAGTGEWSVNGFEGNPGDVIISAGAGSSPFWGSPGGYTFSITNDIPGEGNQTFSVDDGDTVAFINLEVDEDAKTVSVIPINFVSTYDGPVIQTFPNEDASIVNHPMQLVVGSGLAATITGTWNESLLLEATGGGAAPLNEIIFGTGPGVTSDPNLTYDPTTDTLTVAGVGTGIVEAGPGQALSIESDVSIGFSTNGGEKLLITTTGAFEVDGSSGSSGQYLASQGAGAPPVWQDGAPPGIDTQILLSDGAGGFSLAEAYFTTTVGQDAILTLGTNGSENASTGNIITTFQKGGGNGRDGTNLTVRAADAFFPFDSVVADGGTLSILAGTGGVSAVRTGAGGNLIMAAGSSWDFNGGSASLEAGSAENGNGGSVEITAGQGDSGGYVIITAGNANDEGPDGGVEIYAGQSAGNAAHFSVTVNDTERLRIGSQGSWKINGSNGTLGQVLKSNGTAQPPTWTSFTWNTVTADYQLAAADLNNGVAADSASPIDITIPADSTYNFPIGTSILITADNTGTVSILQAFGVTLQIRSPLTNVLNGQYAFATLVKRAANLWYLGGDLV